MSTVLHLYLCWLALVNLASSSPAFVYDGLSIVTMTGGVGQYNWTLKYPLGALCEDQNWAKTLIIHVTANSGEADLIFAFGTQESYFAVGMAYDNVLVVPLSKPDEANRRGSLFVTPRSGYPLQTADASLEQQYSKSTDFRYSLIRGTNQTKEWEVVVGEMADDGITISPMALNSSQIILTIKGDRNSEETLLTVSKNGVNATITMGSTWPLEGEAFLFFGLDAIHEEIFILSGIESIDDCNWTPPPTTAYPTAPSSSPTNLPTHSTSNPSGIPTSTPSAMPSYFPSVMPSTPTNIPTNIPSLIPSKIPSISPTNMPSLTPSKIPSISPVTSSPTADPVTSTSQSMRISINPSISPTMSPILDEDDEGEDGNEDEDQDEDELDTQGGGDGNGLTTLHWIIIGGGLLGLIILIILAWYIGKKCMKKRRDKKRMNELFGNTDDVQSGIEMNNSPTTPNSVNQAMVNSNKIEVDHGIIATNDIPETAALPPEVDEIDAVKTSTIFLDKCEQCGLQKQGNIDSDGDGLFYCIDCWKEYN